MLSTILASGMAFIDSTALNVILPSLQRELDADGIDLFWVLNSYLLMLAALIAVAGSLGDKVGRVRIFKIGILVFSVGSLLCGFSPDIQYLIIFRTLQGIGGALMIPGSLSIISAVFSKDEKGKAIGTWSAATTIVTICGPVIGGALAEIGLWRYIFYINIPLGIFSFLVLHFKVPESYEPGANKIDWVGAVLLVVSLSLITFGFLEIPELGFGNLLVIASLSGGFVLLIVFLFVESNVKDPMIPLGLFKNQTFSGVNLLSFFLYAALGAIMLFLSLNIIQVQGYSQFQAGFIFLPFSFLMFFMGRRMGALTDRYGPRRFLIAGPAIAGLGILGLSQIGITEGPSAYWTTFFPWFMLFASGIALTVVPLTTAVMSSVAESKSGIASGINNSVTRISGTFINAVLGASAIFVFTSFVSEAVTGLELSQSLVKDIISESAKLGEASAADIDTLMIKEKVDEIFDNSFIKTYRLIGIFSAGLAFISSGIAFFMIKEK